VEKLLLAFYDEPDLLRDMIDHLVGFYMQLFEPVLCEVEVDVAFYSEDLCYKNGPLASLGALQEFLVPGYRKLNDFFRSHEVPVIALETDGDCRPVIPLLLDAGITAIWPFEVTNGQNIVEVRKAFPELGIFGGLDKKTLISGSREQIDRELDTKVPFMLGHGGYIPLLDHNASPDISLDSYAHYRRRLTEMVLSK
jgi:uroporphyrinogen decarboxylase